MKRVVYTFLLALFAIAGFAQGPEQETMYVFRNDGDFNAFFVSDIDSITYSNYDADSVLHPDVEVQVIWAKDSTYRIPTAVIDSVTFTKPETKYQPDVVQMDDKWLPYIVRVQGMDITFNQNVSAVWTPRVGDVLVYMNFDDTFPDGFAGRVKAITPQSNEVVVACDSVNIEDIWDEIIIFGEYDVVDEPSSSGAPVKRLKPRRVAASPQASITESVTITWSDINFTLIGNMYNTIAVTYCKQASNFTFELKYSYGMSADFQANISRAYSKTFYGPTLLALKNVPIPNTPLKLDVSLVPLVDLECSSSVTLGYKVGNNGYCGVKFCNGTWSYSKGSSFSKNLTLQTELEGYIGIGTETPITVKAIGGVLSVSANPHQTVGIQCTLSTEVVSALQSDAAAYNLLKDVTVDLLGKLSLTVGGQIKILKWSASYNKTFDTSAKFAEYYLFPDFSAITCTMQKDKKTLSGSVSGSILLPVTPGIQIDNYATYYMDKTHRSGSTAMNADISDLSTGTYTVRPVFRWVGKEISAAPVSELKVTKSSGNLCLESEDENAVFFLKPSNWPSSIYCYTSGSWPGTRATAVGNGYYKVTFSNNVPAEGSLLIWNVGGTQCETNKAPDPQTNDLQFHNRCLYVVSGSAANPNHGDECPGSNAYLPTCSVSGVSGVCNECKCNKK